jgi:hypothetical protein
MRKLTKIKILKKENFSVLIGSAVAAQLSNKNKFCTFFGSINTLWYHFFPLNSNELFWAGEIIIVAVLFQLL